MCWQLKLKPKKENGTLPEQYSSNSAVPLSPLEPHTQQSSRYPSRHNPHTAIHQYSPRIQGHLYCRHRLIVGSLLYSVEKFRRVSRGGRGCWFGCLLFPVSRKGIKAKGRRDENGRRWILRNHIFNIGEIRTKWCIIYHIWWMTNLLTFLNKTVPYILPTSRIVV